MSEQASAIVRLDAESVDAMARRVVELIRERLEGEPVIELRDQRTEQAPVAREWLTAKEKAAQLGVSPDTVRRNANRYGGIRDGDGKRPRWRFPVDHPQAPAKARRTDAAREREPTRRRRSSSDEPRPVRRLRP